MILVIQFQFAFQLVEGGNARAARSFVEIDSSLEHFGTLGSMLWNQFIVNVVLAALLFATGAHEIGVFWQASLYTASLR